MANVSSVCEMRTCGSSTTVLTRGPACSRSSAARNTSPPAHTTTA